MSAWFLISLVLRRSDVADIAWGLGFVLLAWVLYLYYPSVQLSAVVIMITIWGVRLSVHILARNSKKSEDSRYQKWRKDWGRWFAPRSFLQIFVLQGLLLILIAAPALGLAHAGGDTLHWINLLGVFIWSIGFFFEAVSDYELSQFMKNPKNKGRLMTEGLRAYSRHPNYFGEVMLWWGIWLVAFGSNAFFWTIIGPLTITFLILKVSGVPMLEKKYQGNSEFERYKRSTSIFIPLPPKKMADKNR